MPLVDATRTEFDLESLLPAVYRIQDEPRKRPLGSLLEVIGGEAGLLKRNIDDLLDDFFIETCADWVIPYIGDLVGNTILPGRIRRPRADVAKTIYYRRRKGTLPMLEELARDVTLWRAHAVPFFELANWTQHLNHLRFTPQPEPLPPRPRGRVGTASLRDPETADLVDGPFDVTSHSLDIRPVARREGWPALRRLGFFLWRLSAYPLVGVTPAQGPSAHLFHFNPLGIDAPLFTKPAPEMEERELAEEVHVPGPIRRLAFHRQREAYYEESLAVYDGAVAGDATRIPVQRVVPRNLEAWLDPASQPAPGEVAVDVRLGRLAFNDTAVPSDVRVSYTYAFSADMGGGPYPREVDRGDGLWTATVLQTGGADFTSVADALHEWATNAGQRRGVITILDSATYDEPLALSMPASTTLTIQAADRVRPHIRPPGGIAVTYGGDPAALRRSELTLSGLLVEGGVKLAKRTLQALRVVHSTLVPGADPSIDVSDPNDRLRVELESSISGAIRMPAETRGLAAADSIVDAAVPEALAIGGQSAAAYGPTVSLERTTVFGAVRCREVRLASETVFTDQVTSQRRQAGCVRFSYVPPKSLTPRRYRCQPDLALEHDPPPAEVKRILLRLRPQFTAARYGLPAYGQLGRTCPRQVRTGAENGGEMGAFNRLEQPQRESNLRLRLDEYMPFGLDPGLIHVT